jgi:hypothetical protein
VAVALDSEGASLATPGNDPPRTENASPKILRYIVMDGAWAPHLSDEVSSDGVDRGA